MKNTKQTLNAHGNKISRRDFLTRTAAATAAFTIVPRHVLGGIGRVAPSEKVNLAIIGTGGQGTFDMSQFLQIPDVQVVAVCDVYKECDYSEYYFGGIKGWEPARQQVNQYYAEQTGNESYSGCAAYTDFYEMLEEEKDIDAVCVATTDNVHAVASMAAIKKRKHVYCEKPLTHDIYEARMLTKAAKKRKVATQMGNQGHAGEGNRLIAEWIADGAIGDVREAHVWTNRPWGYWPQGVDRPKSVPSVPPTLDWDRWLGPAPWRHYHPAYLPFNWRGWWDFGTGALGDMGCHLIDTPVWALKLGHPTSVQGSATPTNDETGPIGSIVHYDFPARDDMPPVHMVWYEGGLTPPRPKALEEGRRMGNGSGVLLVGDKGTLMCNDYGDSPRMIPETAMQAYTQPPKTIRRSPGIHQEWIDACKGGEPASSNFDVSGPMTEIVLLGNLAVRNAGKILEWDGKKMKVTNLEEANKYVRREYREGWSL
ncbi:MAG: Gfo/Idh/MocA family oxidoreductase [Candidatus Neomarinimicrobiota bacterium]